jgi:PQQ-dependent catabolism-associated CXXCW motif protein
MHRQAQTTEIDITKPARLLALLRLTEYTLVVVCGFMAVRAAMVFIDGSAFADVGSLAVSLIILGVASMAMYSGWQHVGVIDPKAWRRLALGLTVLTVFCVLVAASTAAGYLSAETVARFFSLTQIGVTALIGLISLLLLRKARINSGDASLAQILGRLANVAGTRAVQAVRIRRVNSPRGLAIAVVGAAVLLAYQFLLKDYIFDPAAANVALEHGDVKPKLLESLARAQEFVMSLGFFLLIRARRHFQVDAESLLGLDKRPPTLFLRSFDDDEKQRFSGSQRALLDFSLETRLANHFSQFGPFVAVGSPKDSVPQIGAARVMLSDDAWQARVLEWIAHSRLIVMYSGKTRWVNWELRRIIECGRATRLILMIPEIRAWRRAKRRPEFAARAEHMRRVFAATPWSAAMNALTDFEGIRAMLFRSDGSIVLVRSKGRSRDSYHLAALLSHLLLVESGALAIGTQAARAQPHPSIESAGRSQAGYGLEPFKGMLAVDQGNARDECGTAIVDQPARGGDATAVTPFWRRAPIIISAAAVCMLAGLFAVYSYKSAELANAQKESAAAKQFLAEAAARSAKQTAAAAIAAQEAAEAREAAARQAFAEEAAARELAARRAAQRAAAAREAEHSAAAAIAARQAAEARETAVRIALAEEAAARKSAEKVAAQQAAAAREAAENAAHQTPGVRSAPAGRPHANPNQAIAVERTLNSASEWERQFVGVLPTPILHSGALHGPTPNQIPGGYLVTTQELVAILQKGGQQIVLLDALGGPQKLPGAMLAGLAASPGTFNDANQYQLGEWLSRITRGNRDALLVTYCLGRDCWMSYNAALRAINLGYRRVLWYRGGLEAWQRAGLPLESNIAQATRP